ncbi:hypothetical protein V6Z12_D07G203500 [Gossypium hirsutum]
MVSFLITPPLLLIFLAYKYLEILILDLYFIVWLICKWMPLISLNIHSSSFKYIIKNNFIIIQNFLIIFIKKPKFFLIILYLSWNECKNSINDEIKCDSNIKCDNDS